MFFEDKMASFRQLDELFFSVIRLHKETGDKKSPGAITSGVHIVPAGL